MPKLDRMETQMKKQLKKHDSKFFLRALAAAALLVISTSASAAETSPLTDEQKTLYAIGLSVSRSLNVFTLSPEEFKYVRQGLEDAQANKKSDIDVPTYNSRIQELAKSRRKASGEKQAAAGKDFLEKASMEKGALKTASGMVYTSLAEGKGDSPAATDTVKVNYRGTLIDGTEFDSSFKRGKPIEFKLDNVIKCWTEGVQKMKPGGRAKLVCPPALAYGDNGAGELIFPGATLIFEVELLEVRPADTVKPAAKSDISGTPDKK